VGGENSTITVFSGETLVVEVFVADVAPTPLRGYQVTLEPEAAGGLAGTVSFLPNGEFGCGAQCSPRINTTRPDYAFFQVAGAFPVVALGPPPRVATAAFAGSEPSR